MIIIAEEGEDFGIWHLAFVKLGYGVLLHLHHSCRAHSWAYSVSNTHLPHSRVAAAMETFKQED